LREFVRRYTDGHIAIAIKPTTAQCYRLSIKNHLLPRFGDHQLSKITREEIEQLVGAMLHIPQAARTACVVLSSMFSVGRLARQFFRADPRSQDEAAADAGAILDAGRARLRGKTGAAYRAELEALACALKGVRRGPPSLRGTLRIPE
jgi:hypothetical protein